MGTMIQRHQLTEADFRGAARSRTIRTISRGDNDRRSSSRDPT